MIRSPVDGGDRPVVDIGQTVAASFQTPTLIKIAQDRTEMRIDTSFAEADIGNIGEGQKALYRRCLSGIASVKAKYRRSANPTNQQNVVTYKRSHQRGQPRPILLPGMTAYVNRVQKPRRRVAGPQCSASRFKPADA